MCVPMVVVNRYLVAYNAFQLATWTVALVHLFTGLSWTTTTTIPFSSSSSSTKSMTMITWSTQACGRVLRAVRIGQTLAWLEVLHILFNLNPTSTSTTTSTSPSSRSVMPTFIQCLGRFAVLSWVITPIKSTHKRMETWMLFLVWTIADIIRYLLYLFTLLVPFAPSSSLVRKMKRGVMWMRYSLFMVLQPVGLVCEWMTYWRTLTYVDQNEMYAVRLPNKMNMAFDFGLWNRIVLILYTIAGPYMIRHMLRQRRRKLSTTLMMEKEEDDHHHHKHD